MRKQPIKKGQEFLLQQAPLYKTKQAYVIYSCIDLQHLMFTFRSQAFTNYQLHVGILFSYHLQYNKLWIFSTKHIDKEVLHTLP